MREAHLDNNTWEGEEGRGGAGDVGNGDGGRGCFIEGEEVRVVVVRIRDGRVADWKGAIRDWTLSEEGGLINGV